MAWRGSACSEPCVPKLASAANRMPATTRRGSRVGCGRQICALQICVVVVVISRLGVSLACHALRHNSTTDGSIADQGLTVMHLKAKSPGCHQVSAPLP